MLGNNIVFLLEAVPRKDKLLEQIKKSQKLKIKEHGSLLVKSCFSCFGNREKNNLNICASYHVDLQLTTCIKSHLFISFVSENFNFAWEEAEQITSSLRFRHYEKVCFLTYVMPLT